MHVSNGMYTGMYVCAEKNGRRRISAESSENPALPAIEVIGNFYIALDLSLPTIFNKTAGFLVLSASICTL